MSPYSSSIISTPESVGRGEEIKTPSILRVSAFSPISSLMLERLLMPSSIFIVLIKSLWEAIAVSVELRYVI